jgi:hypothetical protein
MDRTTLKQLLQEADTLLWRGELGIANQREIIAALERRGEDASAEKMRLRRLESRHARHIVDRNRMFKQLADRS